MRSERRQLLNHRQAIIQNRVRQLLKQAALLPPAGSLRPWTYCTLFSLLAITGLRISEALALRFEDITVDGLLIRQTKFAKYAACLTIDDSCKSGLISRERNNPLSA
jgi:integrase/recombinase XerD